MGRFSLEDKQIIVSGAANGIGASLFLELLNEGGSPIGIDIEPFARSELARRISDHSSSLKLGHDFEFFQGDASKKRAMKQVVDSFQRLYGLVNNAGLLGNDETHGGRSIKALNKMMKAHVQTALVLTELSYPRMSVGSSIVNLGSIEVAMAAPNVVLYTAAKGALLGMTVAYATTLAPDIRVNMVSPGNVNTERNKAQYQDKKNKEILRRFEARTPLGRSAEPEEIAHTILFLLSPLSSAITGQEIIVDAGYTRALWDPGWSQK